MARHNRHTHHIRKVCGCPRRAWGKCLHAWYFHYQPAGGPSYCASFNRLVGPGKVTTKGGARLAAAHLITQIDAGTLARLGEVESRPARSRLTLGQLLDRYLVESVALERPHALRDTIRRVRGIASIPVTLVTGASRPFGEWLVVDVTSGAIERFRAARRVQGPVAANRSLSLLRAAFSWAVRLDYVVASPFKRGSETVIKLQHEARRTRRLEPGEEAPLLAACSPLLRAVVEAALQTGCRSGELLSLQWHQVRSTPWAELVLPAQKTKTKTERRIPISPRLRAILDLRRLDGDGQERPGDQFVFGTPKGARVTTLKTAWRVAVLKAHGHEPKYAGRTKGLSAESRAAYRAVGLRFHDLRREAGSRWLDGGVPLQVVRDWLGHANIAQTSTYLASSLTGQHEAMRRFAEWDRLQRMATP